MSKIMQHDNPSTAPAMRPRDLFDEMDQWFEPFFGRGLLRSPFADWPRIHELAGPGHHLPRIDVVEREAEVLVRAELPGVDRKDIELTLNDDRLQIRANTRLEVKEAGEVQRSEVRRGSYARTVALPAAVDPDAARAEFRDGLLELTLPKRQPTTQRRIPVT